MYCDGCHSYEETNLHELKKFVFCKNCIESCSYNENKTSILHSKLIDIQNKLTELKKIFENLKNYCVSIDAYNRLKTESNNWKLNALKLYNERQEGK